MNLRGWEWLILLAVVLLLFGARRLPDLARSVGKSMKIFRSEVKDMTKDEGVGTADGVGPSAATSPNDTATTGTSGPSGPATTDDDGERPRP